MKNTLLSNISSFIENQLVDLCNKYEEKIQKLESEKLQLQEDLLKANNEILLLKQDIDKGDILSETPKSTSLPLKYFREFINAVDANNEPLIKTCLKNFIGQATTIELLTDIHFKEFVRVMLEEIIKTNHKLVVDVILDTLINIKSNKKIMIIKSILEKDNSEVIKILTSNFDLCLEKLGFLSRFELVTFQKNYIENLMDNVTNKSKLNDRERAGLFWYTYLFDLEKQFFKKINQNFNLLSSANPFVSVYFNTNRESDVKSSIEKLKVTLNDLGNFTLKEVQKITKKYEDLNCEKEIPLVKTIYLIKEIDRFRFKDTFQLEARTVLVKFKGKNNYNEPYVDKIQALYDCNDKTVYITEKELLNYERKFNPLKINVSKKNFDFKWPSTELNQNLTNKSYSNLQKVSILKSLGYSFELQASKRWEILNEAVNRYGLKKVAYTLSNITKRLKGRKPDSPAIIIWEDDLNKLKNMYFKKGFTWPNTKII